MGRTWAGLAGVLAALALTGCDPQAGSDPAARAGRASSPAALSAPAPERFAAARGAGGGLDLAAASAPAPAAAARTQLARAAAAAEPGSVPPSDEAAAARASRVFDKVRLAAAPAAAVRRSASGGAALRLTNRPFRIDTDGWISDPRERRRVVSHDRWHRDGTALAIGGRALDSTKVPYISIPGDFTGARLGDLAQVCYGGRCAYAVVGDVGPKGRFGEGSVALARELGIDDDGNTGGVERGVSYTIFASSRGRHASQAALVDDIRGRGPRLALAAGVAGPVQLASL